MNQKTVCEIIGHNIGIVDKGWVRYPGCTYCEKTTREIKEGR